MLARVAPERRTTNKYVPYPPKLASTTSQAMAPANPAVAGGVRSPRRAVTAENTTAAVVVCTVSDAGRLATGRQRRSSRVPADRPATATTGSA